MRLAGHPLAIDRLLVLLVEVTAAAGHQALHGHCIWRAAQGLDIVYAMPVDPGEQMFRRFAVSMRLEVELAGESVVEEPGPVRQRQRRRASQQATSLLQHTREIGPRIEPVVRGDQYAAIRSNTSPPDPSARSIHSPAFSSMSTISRLSPVLPKWTFYRPTDGSLICNGCSVEHAGASRPQRYPPAAG